MTQQHLPPPGAPEPGGRHRSPYAAELAFLLSHDASSAADPAAVEGRLLEHSPGPLPLRPLRFGEVLSVAFQILRTNPGATFGAGLIASAIVFGAVALLAALASLVLAVATPWSFSTSGLDAAATAIAQSAVGLGASLGIVMLGACLMGMVVAPATQAAAAGELISLAEAWRRTEGRRGAALGLAALTVGVGGGGCALVGGAFAAVASVAPPVLGALLLVLGIPVTVGFAVWAAFRWFVMAPPIVILERLGPVAAIRRAGRLTRRSVLRVMGCFLASLLLCAVASYFLASFLVLLVSLVMSLGPLGELAGVALAGFGTLVPSAVAVTYLGLITNVTYLDVRIRNEGYDVELRAIGRTR